MTEFNLPIKDRLDKIIAKLKEVDEHRMRRYMEFINAQHIAKKELGFFIGNIFLHLTAISQFIYCEFVGGTYLDIDWHLFTIFDSWKDNDYKFDFAFYDWWHGGVEQIMFDIFDGIAVITAQKDKNGKVCYDDDTYIVFDDFVEEWFENHKEIKDIGLLWTENEEINKKLEGYDVHAFYNDLNLISEYLQKYA